MASNDSGAGLPDALLNQDAMGAAASHEVQTSEETTDTAMTGIGDMSDRSNQAMERPASDKARKTLKRAFEVEEEEAQEFEDADDSEIDPDFAGQREDQSLPSTSKRQRVEGDEEGYVYIGHHINEPTVEAWARWKANGHVLVHGRPKKDSPPVPNWSDYVGPKKHIKHAEIKFDPSVYGDYQGPVDNLSHKEKTNMIEKYLLTLEANNSHGIVKPHPSKMSQNMAVSKPSRISEANVEVGPLQLEVGLHKDGETVITAKLVKSKWDSEPRLEILAPVGSPPLKGFEDVVFLKAFDRGSLKDTKACIKAKLLQEMGSVSNTIQGSDKGSIKGSRTGLSTPKKQTASPLPKIAHRSKANRSGIQSPAVIQPNTPIEDKIGTGFDNIKAILDDVLASKIVNDVIMPALDILRQDVEGLKSENSDFKSDVVEKTEKLASLTTTNEEQAVKIIDFERMLQDCNQTIEELTTTNVQHVESIAAAQSVIQVRDQTIREMTATKDTIVREHLSTLEPLQSRIRELEELRTANQRAAPSANPHSVSQPPVPEVAAMQAEITQLKKDLSASEATRQTQAQKIADLTFESQDQKKEPVVIDQETSDKEKNDKIKAMEEQISNLQSEIATLKISSPVSSTQPLELYGLSFADKFKKLADGAVKARDVYKERNGLKMRKGGVWMQQIRILQKSISVGGVYENRDEEIDGVMWAVLTEGGKKKLVRHKSSKVVINGEEYILYDTMKETEEESDEEGT